MVKKYIFIIMIMLASISAYADGGIDFNSAVLITDADLPEFSDTGTIFGDERQDNYGQASNDVIYRIRSAYPVTNLDISLEFSLFDTYLSFVAADQTTLIEENDDYRGFSANQSAIMNLSIEANTDYYIVVEGYGTFDPVDDLEGFFYLDITGEVQNPNAPEAATNMLPANTTANIATATTLTWDFGHQTDTYDLLLDNVSPPVNVVVSNATAEAVGSYAAHLDHSSTYFWQIVSKNALGFSTDGPEQYFQTIDGGLISNIQPADAATNQDTNIALSWNFDEYTQTYDVYLDTVNPPVAKVVDNANAISLGTGTYQTSNLQQGQTYYWKVVCKDTGGMSKTNGVYSFHTVLPNGVVQVGYGTVTNKSLPIEPVYKYTYSQSIFLQSELDTSNQCIKKIAYHFNGSGILDDSNDWVIYMGHTSSNSFENNNSWIPYSQLTLVDATIIDADQNEGWIEFTLDTPFVYNNIDNLVVSVEENADNYDSGSSEFYCTNTTENRSIVYRSDSTNPNPENPPIGVAKTAIPNVRITFDDIPTEPVINIDPTSFDFGLAIINSSSNEKEFTIRNTGGADLIIQNPITLQSNAHFALIDTNTYPLTIPVTQAATFKAKYMPTEFGNHTNSIVINSNTTGGASSIPIQGNCEDIVVTAFPFTESFDTAELPAHWIINPIIEGDSWEITNTEVGGHGADVEHTGNNGYMLTVDDSSPTTAPAHLYSPHLNLAGLNNPVLSFYYWIGDRTNSSELFVDVISENVVTPAVASFTNPDGTASNGWKNAIVSLSQFTGQTIQIDFRAMEASGYTYNGDISIDDVEVFDNTVPPMPATLVYPENNASNTVTFGKLNWNEVNFADAYKIYLGTNNPPTNIVNGIVCTDTTNYDFGELSGGTTYYWQIVPFNANGNAINCPVWNFTTTNLTPNAITLTYPSANATQIIEQPTFTWQADTLAFGYKFFISSNGLDFDLTDVGNATNYQITEFLENNQTYHWYVTAYNINGDGARPTQPASFTTQPNKNFGGDGTLYGGYYYANSTPNGNGFGYQPEFNWIDISSTGTVPTFANRNADDGYIEVPIGFNFNFFENSYNSIYITTNGLAIFTNPSSASHSTINIPGTNGAENLIAMLAMDLHTDQAPTSCYYGNDTEGNFVFTAENWNDYNDSNETIDVQVILYPSGRIKIQYKDYTNPDTESVSSTILGDACIGIENFDGTIGHEYRNNNNGGALQNNMALSYAPSIQLLAETTASLPTPVITSIEAINNSSIKLTWQTVNGANLYKVYKSNTPNVAITPANLVIETTNTSYTYPITENASFWCVVAVSLNPTPGLTLNSNKTFKASLKQKK